MAILVNNRTQETCAAPGTGTVTLLGAVTGYRTFSAGIGANNLTYYTIADQTGSNWEVGIGTVGSGGTTLIRTTVLDSSNSGSLTNFSSGTQLVYSDYPANAAVLQTDVGTAPNQIPLNQYLGKLAFEDVLDTVSNNPYYDTQISDVEPTLNLDFVNSKTLDSRITFTRSTTATYYDGKTSAVAEQNLFLYSQTFGNAAWVSTNNTITTGITDPASGTTAQTLTASASNSTFYQTVTLTATANTVSFYVQRVTGTGTINFTLDGTNFTAISAPTGSWVRYSITATPTAGAKTVGIQIVTSGDAINIAFGQLENRSSATAYNVTTTTAITNYIPALQTAAINQARLDYNPVTGTPNGLLIEEQRTNLLTYSSDYTQSVWTKLNSTVTATANIAPDGTQNAQLIIPSTASGGHNVYELFTPSVSTAYTVTGYFKAGGYNFCTLYLNGTGLGAFSYFNLSTGALGTIGNSGTGSTPSATITSVGNGWYRCSLTQTSAATVGSCQVSYQANFADNQGTWTGNGFSGIYIWGAQLEAGAFPTSYIPTVASQVTRSGDLASMTGTNFSSWYNISQGSLYVEAANMPSVNQTAFYATINNTTYQSSFSIWKGNSALSGDGNLIGTTRVSQSGSPYFTVLNSGVAANSSMKAVASYTLISSLSISANGNAAVSQTFSIPQPYTPVALRIGGRDDGYQINGNIRKLQYYPQALSNAELQEMTS